MKRINTNIIGLIVMVMMLSSVVGHAQDECPEPSAMVVMDYNNVAATINTGEMLFFDGSEALYEVPKGGDANAIFAVNMWMGGRTADNQLHLSGTTYNAFGSSFLTGPLGEGGQLVPGVCEQYDQIFIIERVMSELHASYFESVENGTVDEDFPDGYVIPQVLLDYPGNGDVTLGIASQLAPYHDDNNNGIYEPAAGDYPLFSGMDEVSGCTTCQTLNGDVSYFWIDNDMNSLGEDSNPLGVEIHNVAYAFSTNNALNNTTFYQKKIINRSNTSYTNFYLGIFADMDLGNANDDFVACDVERNMGIVYNSDDFDENTNGSFGYGENPPTAGIVLLNPTNSISDEVTSMSSFISFKNLSVGVYPQVDPDGSEEFYNYLAGYWQNGSPLTYGGNGLDGEVECSYMLPRDSDPTGLGTNGVVQEAWSEESSASVAGDRRFVISQGPYDLNPGDSLCLSFAIVYSPSEEGNGVAENIAGLGLVADEVQEAFDQCYAGLINGISNTDWRDIATINWSMQSSLLAVVSLDGQPLTVVVYDDMGRTVFEDQMDAMDKKDLSFLASGTYIVRAMDDEGHASSEKIVKMK